MRLSVSLLPSVRTVDTATQVAVVIDVLRATSVMTTAMANGASEFVTFEDIGEATHFANGLSSAGERVLLCGERHCKRIEGFQLGNSPSEYTDTVVANTCLVLTTTNGTRAIAAAESVETVLIGSFLNLSSLVAAISTRKSVHLVCAGTNGEITAEDVSLAGAIIQALQAITAVELHGDDAILAHGLWESWFPVGTTPNPRLLANRFRETFGGRNLVKEGFQDDLLLCSQINSRDVVPQLTDRNPSRFKVELER